jgi:histidine ammonia-lyase
MQEDHVSMGWGAARKLRQALVNLTRILAVELVCSARALQLRAPLSPAATTAAVVALLDLAPGPDRILAPDLALAADMIASGAVVEAASSVMGPLR